MPRWNDALRGNPVKKGNGAGRFFFTVITLIVSFLSMVVLAYFFRLMSTEPHFRPRDFWTCLSRDVHKLQDPNTKLALKRTWNDFKRDFSGR